MRPAAIVAADQMGTARQFLVRTCTKLATFKVSHVVTPCSFLHGMYLKDSKVGPVPGSKQRVGVWAETRLVQQRRWKVVPCLVGATVDTSDLVVRQRVVLVHSLESFHAENIQIPLVGILVQLTNLKTWVRCGARAASTVRVAWAGNGDGPARLTLFKLAGDLVDVSLNDCVDRPGRMLVVGAVLKGNRDLEESKDGDQHGHHALRLTEIGHCEGNVHFSNPERKATWAWKEVDLVAERLRLWRRNECNAVRCE